MRIFGIDLGTTNSLIAVMTEGEPQVISAPGASPMVPSAVYFSEEGQVSIGAQARPKALVDPFNTITSVKRFMGKGLNDIQPAERVRYRFVAGNEGIVRFMVRDKEVTPPEISALILQELKNRAQEVLQEEVSKVVITVPAYFNDSQRQATKDAGKIAGLDVVRLVNEPTAAALAYGLQEKREGRIAVYDLGGGTFDISILRLHDGIFEVLATGGDTHLGGDDIDLAFADWLASEIDVSQRDIPSAEVTLRNAAEESKRALSQAQQITIEVAFPDGEAINRTVTREQFEEIIAPIVQTTLDPCRQALKDAGLTAQDIDEVVLVGGSTRVPLVRQEVAKLFDREPLAGLNPDEVVALGAAVQGAILAGEGKSLNMLLMDVVPLSLGIETMGGEMTRLIHRNTTIPTQHKEVYTNQADNQTYVPIHILQGEREQVADNRSLARFNLPLDPLPAGQARIEVTFLIDANGILNVAARELRTGKEARIEVQPSYGLSQEEVGRMLREAQENTERDKQAAALIKARNDAGFVLKPAKKMAEEQSDLASQQELTGIKEAIARLEEALEGADAMEIARRSAALDNACAPFALRIQDRAMAQIKESQESS